LAYADFFRRSRLIPATDPGSTNQACQITFIQLCQDRVELAARINLNLTLMYKHLSLPCNEAERVDVSVITRSDRIINYFLGGYFLLGVVFAGFYDTWFIAVGVGGFAIAAYYSAKFFLPNSCLYQYVLSVILGLFMAQFIYQMHGMFEMHFFAFIGSALLITYQKWKLQLPMLLFVLIHHATLSRLQDMGDPKVYFSQLNYFDLQTFLIHIVLTLVIFFISGLCAYQLHKYHRIQLRQTAQMNELQEGRKNEEALLARNIILESIGDAFFAVDKNWDVTYWNQMAEKVLYKTKEEMLNHNLWAVFSTSIESASYRMYHQATLTNLAVHFEDYFEPLYKWYEVSAYPSESGLSVYFKDITERKKSIADLRESEKRYSDVFHFSPLPMWVVDLDTLRFLDVNRATIAHYGYTRDEFLTMTLKDIRPKEELLNLKKGLAAGKDRPEAMANMVMIHRKKNGELINVEIQVAPFQFNGVKTSIVIGTDITEQLKYVKAIEEQNEKLRAISWMQSHVIRAPLARIMGLLPMFNDLHTSSKEKKEIMGYLIASAGELDEVIRDITDITRIVPVN